MTCCWIQGACAWGSLLGCSMGLPPFTPHAALRHHGLLSSAPLLLSIRHYVLPTPLVLKLPLLHESTRLMLPTHTCSLLRRLRMARVFLVLMSRGM
jgi:hypothetical protein